MLTKEEYTQYDRSLCPFCMSEDIEFDDIDFHEGTGYMDVECEECGMVWIEEWTLNTVYPHDPSTAAGVSVFTDMDFLRPRRNVYRYNVEEDEW